MQSGVIRVLFVMVRMIEYLWARVSKMWLLGELGILFFCSLLPRIWCVLGVFCARFPPREVNIRFLAFIRCSFVI